MFFLGKWKSDVPSFRIHIARWHRVATALPCWSILPLRRDPRERSDRRRPAGSRAICGDSRFLPPPRSTPDRARYQGSRCSGAAGWWRLRGSSRSTSCPGRPCLLAPASCCWRQCCAHAHNASTSRSHILCEGASDWLTRVQSPGQHKQNRHFQWLQNTSASHLWTKIYTWIFKKNEWRDRI